MKSINKYVESLVRIGFIIPRATNEWKASPHLVAKENSRAPIRKTILLRPVNAATERIECPMPKTDAQLQDFEGRAFFAIIDFLSGNWKLAVHPGSYGECGVITKTGVYSSTREVHGLKMDRRTYSQRGTISSELRNYMKAWVDDLNLLSKTENGLLRVIEKSFEICEQFNLFVLAQKSSSFC